jgi:hypothetical protein
MITLPALIELLKLYLIQVEHIIPEFTNLSTLIQKITTLQIIDESSKKFLNKLRVLNTQIHNGRFFELNSALNFSPSHFSNITTSYDNLYTTPITNSTIKPSHPFIMALHAIGKSFFDVHTRKAYQDFIQGPFTTMLSADIASAITAQGGRIGGSMNDYLRGVIPGFINHAFSQMHGSNSPNISLGGSRSPGGSDAQKHAFLEFLHVILHETTTNYDTLINTTDGTIIENPIQITVNTVDYTPTYIQTPLGAIEPVELESTKPIYEDLDTYVSSVITRTGFSKESYVFLDELYAQCETVFNTPYEDDVLLLVEENENMTGMPVKEPVEMNENMTGMPVKTTIDASKSARAPGISPEKNGDTVMLPPGYPVTPELEYESYDAASLSGNVLPKQGTLDGLQINNDENMAYPSKSREQSAITSLLDVTRGVASGVARGGATRIQKKRRLRTGHIKTQRAK